MKATIKNILYACERLLQQNNYKDDSIPKGLVSCDGDVEVSYKDHYETFPSVKEAIASMRAAVEDKLGEKFEDFSGTDYFDFIQEGRVDKTLDLPIGIILNSEDEVLILYSISGARLVASAEEAVNYIKIVLSDEFKVDE
jgi:hypothetical protein